MIRPSYLPIIEASGWQRHTVLGAISDPLKKMFGLTAARRGPRAAGRSAGASTLPDQSNSINTRRVANPAFGMDERTMIGRGILFNPSGDPIKKVDYEITSEESQGRFRGVPKGFLVSRKGWSLLDEVGQRWLVETEFAFVDEGLAGIWIDVVVKKAK